MKVVDVEDQVRLGLAKSFELCVSGIRYRLFRSAVTVATVVLAVAFLMTMLGQSVIASRVRDAVSRQTAPRRYYVGWLARLGEPLADGDAFAVLAAQPPEADRLAELAAWASSARRNFRRPGTSPCARRPIWTTSPAWTRATAACCSRPTRTRAVTSSSPWPTRPPCGDFAWTSRTCPCP